MSLPAEFDPLDVLAVLAFFLIWLGYNLFLDGRWRRPGSINARMVDIREIWMRRLLERDNRIGDTQLIGHAIRSATFFASTTMLLLAGIFGVVSSAETIHAASRNLSVLLLPGSLALFEVKLLTFAAIFVYAFFKFTWAIRQFNYFSAFIGAAPLPGSDVPEALPRRMAHMLSQALGAFNGGVRAYYFALASLGWLIHPLLWILGTLLITAVLVRRQLYSGTADLIDAHARDLARGP